MTTNDLDYIIGSMRTAYDALGFVPDATVNRQYITNERYAIQTDNRGRRVGYILHGKPVAGRTLSIAQAFIDYEFQRHGFGESAVDTVIQRAKSANCAAVKLRCADDLAANAFWQALGFERTATFHPANTRRRAINIYVLQLWPTLFGGDV